MSDPSIRGKKRHKMTDEESQNKTRAVPPRGSPSDVTPPEGPELTEDEVDLEEDWSEQKPRERSRKGGEGVIAAHEIERLRRSGSSYGEFRAGQLEKNAENATRAEVIKVASGEVVRAGDSLPYTLRNTLENPTIVTADASEHRTRLAAAADVLEMAADAAETFQAQNSVEKMQAHQLAAAHKMAMHFAKLAMEQEDGVLACKFVKASAAAMRSYTQGVDSMHRARRGGRQIVTIQRVNVNEGGQAVITGQVNEPAQPAN